MLFGPHSELAMTLRGLIFVLLAVSSCAALDAPADDLDIDLDAPNLGDDDFQDMMDEDDVPVGPVHRQKWRNTNEGSIVRKGPPRVFTMAPIPEPTKPTKLTKVQPTPGVGIGFYGSSKSLYGPAPSTGRPPWPQGTGTAAVVVPRAPAAPALAWLAPKYVAAPPPPPPPHSFLERQWSQQHRFVSPYFHQTRPCQSQHHPQPGMIVSMGKVGFPECTVFIEPAFAGRRRLPQLPRSK